MAMHVKLTYEDEYTQTYVVLDNTVKLYGLKRNGRRPYKADCWLQGTAPISADTIRLFVDKFLRYSLHPIKREIILSPDVQELYDADSD